MAQSDSQSIQNTEKQKTFLSPDVLELHRHHPFYQGARAYWEVMQREQIDKGAGKYPEPLNPFSWSGRQLVEHAFQENVDQAHYSFAQLMWIQEVHKATAVIDAFLFHVNMELVQVPQEVRDAIEKLKKFTS